MPLTFTLIVLHCIALCSSVYLTKIVSKLSPFWECSPKGPVGKGEREGGVCKSGGGGKGVV